MDDNALSSVLHLLEIKSMNLLSCIGGTGGCGVTAEVVVVVVATVGVVSSEKPIDNDRLQKCEETQHCFIAQRYFMFQTQSRRRLVVHFQQSARANKLFFRITVCMRMIEDM